MSEETNNNLYIESLNWNCSKFSINFEEEEEIKKGSIGKGYIVRFNDKSTIYDFKTKAQLKLCLGDEKALINGKITITGPIEINDCVLLQIIKFNFKFEVEELYLLVE